MANNLRYLLEHFCLDGQTIDISSQLDEENADKIEKLNNETIPNINSRIDGIKDTDIPNINSRIDGIKNTDIPTINQKINSINNTTIPSIDRKIDEVDGKADSINVKVEKNSKDIATLSDNVTVQGNDINTINTEKITRIEKSINDNDSAINKKVDEMVQGLGDSINGINHYSIPLLEADIEAANKKIDGNTSNINEIKNTDIPNLRQGVSDNETNISGLTTKVNANTESINTINNTDIPNLQNQIDSLSSGGSGSIEDLREKVQTNTNDISTIKDTSIPSLQNQINALNPESQWTSNHFNAAIKSNEADIFVYYNESQHIAIINFTYNVSTTGLNENTYVSLKPTNYNAVYPKYELAIPLLQHSHNTAISGWLDMRPNKTFGMNIATRIPTGTKLSCNYTFQTL